PHSGALPDCATSRPPPSKRGQNEECTRRSDASQPRLLRSRNRARARVNAQRSRRRPGRWGHAPTRGENESQTRKRKDSLAARTGTRTNDHDRDADRADRDGDHLRGAQPKCPGETIVLRSEELDDEALDARENRPHAEEPSL